MAKKKGQPAKKIVKAEVKNAILHSSSSLLAIAKMVGVHYKTLRRYLDKHEDLIELIETQRKRMVEQAEDVVYKAIEEGDVKTAKWLLKVKGGDQWNETTKVEHSGDLGISINIIDKKEKE